jgi:hypothetical protein
MPAFWLCALLLIAESCIGADPPYKPSTYEAGDVNNYYNLAGIGTWGGICTCPNGKSYEVGDIGGSACGILPCNGGAGAGCSRGGIATESGHYTVDCAPLDPALTVATDGGGWLLVRRVQSGGTWHTAADSHTGSEPDYGTYDPDWTSENTFGLQFSTSPYDQVLVATGDLEHWVIITKTSWLYSSGAIVKSSASCEPSTVVWQPPWISLGDYGSADAKVLYGEDGSSEHVELLSLRNGANVFVRVICDYSVIKRLLRI